MFVPQAVMSPTALSARAATVAGRRGALATKGAAMPVVVSRRSMKVMAAKIAVFGGSGGCGKECIYQALAQGHEVVTLARTPAKVVIPPGSGGEELAGKPFDNTRLSVVAGNVTNAADVAKVLTADVDGVVVALGGKTKDVGPTMLTDGTTNVINAMKSAGVSKVAVVTSIGCGDSSDQAPLVFKLLMMTVMSSIFNDKNNQEKLFLEGPGKDLDYCIVRPGGLNEEAPTGVVNVIKGEAGSIARADVADFCLGALFDASFPYLKQTPCISSVGGTSWTKDRGDKGMMEA